MAAKDAYEKIKALIQATSDMKDLPKLFSAVDTDGNGDIDMMEFSAFLDGCASTSGHDAIGEDEIKATFDYIDTNGNGMIDFDEFEYFFYVRGGGGKDEAQTETKQSTGAVSSLISCSTRKYSALSPAGR